MADVEIPFSSKCIAEFIGTYLLVFTIGCNVLSGNTVWAGVSIASVLMVAIYSLGKISGGNFNPSVSFTLGLSKSLGGPGMPWNEVGWYALVQTAAGILAGCSYTAFFKDKIHLEPAKGFGVPSAGCVEMLYTLMLCFVVLNVAAVQKPKENQWYGLAIAFVVIAGAYGAGAISGGCFNPAVAIGIDISGGYHGYCFAYAIAETLGASLAALLFAIVRPQEFSSSFIPEGSPIPAIVAEFLGTFFLVLTVGLNVLGKSVAGAFSIAASLMSMIYALGDVSGANFNPAVTVAILATGAPDFSVAKAAGYIVVQILGGIAAAMTYVCIYGGTSFALEPQGNSSWKQVAVAEIIFTFLLCFVVLCTAVAKQTKSEVMFGLAIGSCVTVGGFAIGGISGGSLNPAVSWGIAVSNAMNGGLSGLLPALAYTGFEIGGGLMAAGALKATHRGLDAPKKDIESD